MSEFVAEHLALHFPKDRWTDLERNITAAAAECGYTEVEHFIQRILSAPMTREDVAVLTSHLAVNETYFWREPETFEALEQSILPELIRSRHGQKRIRIWSAGCSTGEEPYSIAIALHRAIPKVEDWSITILATDINPRILYRASTGLFGQWSFRHAPRWLQENYMLRQDKDMFEVLPEIKRMVTFEYLNLADGIFATPLNETSAMDIIFCRNVLMYFSEKRRSQVVRGLFNSLIHHGFLVVSACELSLQSLSEFTAVNYPGMVLFQKTSKNLRAEQQAPAETPVPAPLEHTWRSGRVNTIEDPEPQFRQSETEVLPETEIPLHSLPRIDKALELYAKGNYAEVSEMLQQKDLTSEEQMLSIRAYANEGKTGMALQSCARAITADKLNPGLHYLYATLLQEDHQLENAAASLKRAIFLDSNFVLSYYSLGQIYRRLGDVTSAKRCAENVLTMLNACGQNDILLGSGGLTAGRFREMVLAADHARDRV